MALTYDKRNRTTIEELAPNTKVATKKLYEFAVKNNIDILIYDGIRTLEEQKANVAKGVSQTMKSYHLVGQAFDFVPVKDGKAIWNGYESTDVKKFVAEAKRLGFEWGGEWKNFVDKPHMQFNYKGYGMDKKIETPAPKPTPKPVAETFTVELHKSVSKSDAYKLAEFAEKLGFDAIVRKA